MRTNSSATLVRFTLIGLLALGWFVGLIVHRASVEATGYMDIPTELLYLGCVLCALAGFTVRVVAPHRRLRAGVLAGIGMMVTIVVSFYLLAFAYDRLDTGENGETWFSFLLESWFWIGIPVVGSALLGGLGWLSADWLGRIGRGMTHAA